MISIRLNNHWILSQVVQRLRETVTYVEFTVNSDKDLVTMTDFFDQFRKVDEDHWEDHWEEDSNERRLRLKNGSVLKLICTSGNNPS